MEFNSITFRSTLFPQSPIQMDEKWIAKLNSIMSIFELVPSVGTTYNISMEQPGGNPKFDQQYFINFKKFDDSFKITFLPDRFDIEKKVSSISISAPISEFLKNAEEIWSAIKCLELRYCRVALALIAEIKISDAERGDIITKLAKKHYGHTATELSQRIVYKTNYNTESPADVIRTNEVQEFGCDNISANDSFMKIGLDYNSSMDNNPEIISSLYMKFLTEAGRRITTIMDAGNIRNLLGI